MNIPGKPTRAGWKKHRKHRRNHEQLERHFAEFFDVKPGNTRPACLACHGSRKCARCQGEGCGDCDYIGRCVECIDKEDQ